MNNSKKATVLMLLSVSLWMFYPPIVDILLQKFEQFYLAAIIHSVAAIVITVLLYLKIKNILFEILKNIGKQKIYIYTFLAGLFSCANHLLLYKALDLSNEFDVVAILIFETWPLLFLYLDTVIRRKILLNYKEILFSFTAFIGFFILVMGNFDFENLKISNNFINVSFFAFLGGLGMALTCFTRIKCVDKWKAVSEKNNIKLTDFNISLLTEALTRVVAAPLFILIFFISGNDSVSLNGLDIFMILFVGLFILAIGNVLYDLSIYLSSSPTIGSLWYLMPIGSILLLSIYKMEMLSINEILAIVILIMSNVLIAYNKKIDNRKTLFFVTLCFGSLLYSFY